MTTVSLARPARSPLASAHLPARRSSFGRLLAVEARKLVDTRASIGLIAGGLSLALVVAVVGILAGVDANAHGAELVISWTLATSYLGGGLGLFLSVFAVLSITSEWTQRSALTTFALEPRRGRVLLAKVAALALVTFALAVFSAGIGAVMVAAARAAGARTSWELGAAPFAGFTASLLVTTAMGVALGLLFLNSAAGIAAFFVLPMLASLADAAGALWQPWAQVSPWVLQRTSLAALGDGTIAGAAWGQLLTSSLLWIGLPAAVGTWRWLRRQVS